MKRGLLLVLAALLLIWLIGADLSASAGTNVSVNIGLPAVVVAPPPEMVVVPNTSVYFAPDVEADVFFHRGHWYARRGDRWFRAGACDGPWTAVGRRYVPVEIVRVPRDYRTVYVREERVPYGQLKKHWKTRESERHAWKGEKHRRRHHRRDRDD